MRGEERRWEVATRLSILPDLARYPLSFRPMPTCSRSRSRSRYLAYLATRRWAGQRAMRFLLGSHPRRVCTTQLVKGTTSGRSLWARHSPVLLQQPPSIGLYTDPRRRVPTFAKTRSGRKTAAPSPSATILEADRNGESHVCTYENSVDALVAFRKSVRYTMKAKKDETIKQRLDRDIPSTCTRFVSPRLSFSHHRPVSPHTQFADDDMSAITRPPAHCLEHQCDRLVMPSSASLHPIEIGRVQVEMVNGGM
jgi:hypothetical protein